MIGDRAYSALPLQAQDKIDRMSQRLH